MFQDENNTKIKENSFFRPSPSEVYVSATLISAKFLKTKIIFHYKMILTFRQNDRSLLRS